jgi:tRNA threonylcarbamoyladenosine biosynthesis protein TsaB
MQKQKIDLPTLYLVLQSSYDDIQLALYHEEQILGKKTINKIYASRDLILNIDFLLNENQLTIQNLSFLIVNQGPGPFTTLRVVVSTANALNFSGNLPLIGVDGLDAIINEFKNENFPITIALLNAFNNDVYYAIYHDNIIEKGWKNIGLLLSELKSAFPLINIRFIGNGADIFKNEITQSLGNFAYFQDPNPKICSIEQIAKIGYEKWKDKSDIYPELNPLYLKEAIKLKKEFA